MIAASRTALRGRGPESQDAVPGDITKVSVGGQHHEVVAETKLRQQRIDGAGLNAAAPAFVFQFGRVRVLTSVGNQHRQCGEPIEDLAAVARSGEALQKLLQNEASGHEFLAGLDSADQFASFLRRSWHVAPES